MGFWDAVKSALRKYATTSGRASRSEYWYFVLFGFLVTVIASLLDTLVSGGGVLYGIVALALVLPQIAIAVRRLHDRDRSGWWYLIVLIPFGAIVLIVWFCMRGTPGPNRFGNDPLAGAGGPVPRAVT